MRSNWGLKVMRNYQATQQLMVCSGVSRCSSWLHHLYSDPSGSSASSPVYHRGFIKQSTLTRLYREAFVTSYYCFMLRQLGETLEMGPRDETTGCFNNTQTLQKELGSAESKTGADMGRKPFNKNNQTIFL